MKIKDGLIFVLIGRYGVTFPLIKVNVYFKSVKQKVMVV